MYILIVLKQTTPERGQPKNWKFKRWPSSILCCQVLQFNVRYCGLFFCLALYLSRLPNPAPEQLSVGLTQGVTKRCRLSWLTNSVLVYEPKCGGEGGSCGVSANEYSCTQEPKNFGDQNPYLTHGLFNFPLFICRRYPKFRFSLCMTPPPPGRETAPRLGGGRTTARQAKPNQ